MATFYESAARVLDVHDEGKSSLKAIVDKHADDTSGARRLLALCVSTLEYRSALDKVLDASDLLRLERNVFRPPSAASKRKASGDVRQQPIKGTGTKSYKAQATTSQARPNPRALALVLVHDLLCSRGISASASWPPRAAVERHRARLKAEIIKVQLREGKSRIDQLRLGAEDRDKAARVPRWARVNEGMVTVNEVIEALELAGWKFVEGPMLVKGRTFTTSSHVPSVLAFHPSSTSSLLSDPLYKTGKIILQDLASCMPAWILLGGDPIPLGDDDMLIDATSAPGNKTSHMSSLVHLRQSEHQAPGARITAFEHSPQRFKTLTSLLGKAGALYPTQSSKVVLGKRKHVDASTATSGAHNVQAVLGDFLSTVPDDEQWSTVTHMILDPSCSGSGIMGRMDYLQAAQTSVEQEEDDANEEEDAEEGTMHGAGGTTKQARRLAKLGEFQLKMILSAMRFPALRRLTYSTCSIHAEENEHVVMRALASPIAIERGWRLAPRAQVVPGWNNRGKREECGGDMEAASSMLRCDPGGSPSTCPSLQDLRSGQAHVEATNGFFVVCFVRQTGGSQGEAEALDANGRPADGYEAAQLGKKRKKKSKKNKGKGEQVKGDTLSLAVETV